MRIGVPTEIKSNEFRVGLVPGSVRELTARGHDVVVQSGAGAGIFADDAAYEKAGARIAEWLGAEAAIVTSGAAAALTHATAACVAGGDPEKMKQQMLEGKKK